MGARKRRAIRIGCYGNHLDPKPVLRPCLLFHHYVFRPAEGGGFVGVCWFCFSETFRARVVPETLRRVGSISSQPHRPTNETHPPIAIGASRG